MGVQETARVRNKGQVTIPKPIREHLGIDEGTTVTFEVTYDGTVTLSPETDSWELLEEIQAAPRRTEKTVEELLTASEHAWSDYE